jgi:hypothetical protein
MMTTTKKTSMQCPEAYSEDCAYQEPRPAEARGRIGGLRFRLHRRADLGRDGPRGQLHRRGGEPVLACHPRAADRYDRRPRVRGRGCRPRAQQVPAAPAARRTARRAGCGPARRPQPGAGGGRDRRVPRHRRRHLPVTERRHPSLHAAAPADASVAVAERRHGPGDRAGRLPGRGRGHPLPPGHRRAARPVRRRRRDQRRRGVRGGCLLCWLGGNGRVPEQEGEPFGHRRVGVDRAAQGRVGDAADHGGLDGRQQFGRLGPERGEAEDLVAVGGDQHLHEPAGLGDGLGPQDSGHRHAEQAVADPEAPGLGLVEADPGQLRIGVHAERDQPAAGGPAAAGQVVMHHLEVVEGRMGELGAARAVSHRPHAGRGGGQVLVDGDVAGFGQPHADLLEADAAGVGRTADGDQQIGPVDGELTVRPFGDNAHGPSGLPVDGADLRLAVQGDPLVAEQPDDARRDVGVFVAERLRPGLDDRDLRAEPAHGLRQLQPDVAAADDDQMFRQPVQVKQLDVGHRSRLGQTGHVRHGRAGAQVQEHPLAADLPPAAVVQLDVDRSLAGKARLAHDQLGAAGAVPGPGAPPAGQPASPVSWPARPSCWWRPTPGRPRIRPPGG